VPLEGCREQTVEEALDVIRILQKICIGSKDFHGEIPHCSGDLILKKALLKIWHPGGL
jgi:hypothetical protein